MIRKEIKKLEYLLTVIPGMLRQLDDQTFSNKPKGNGRSKKEIIGHLIDCATNNHQTLASFQHMDGLPTFYDLHNWNKYGYYRQSSQLEIIALWESSNVQLLETIKAIPDVNLRRKCVVGSKLLTMKSLIRKYVEDLENHLADVIICGLATESRTFSTLNPVYIQETKC